MILTKKELKVKAANYVEVPNKVELVVVDVMSEEGDLTVATLYMPPKTRAWETEEHTERRRPNNKTPKCHAANCGRKL